MPHLLSMHGISGCDTVSKIYGIGKLNALSAIKKGHFPPPLGDPNVSHEDLQKDGASFIGAYYGTTSTHATMSEHRFQKWKNTTKGKGKTFKLETLPPTTEGFSMHIRRAHGQVGVWRSASHPDPPDIDPSEYG